MIKPVRRYTFKKKADSLDISRYGLWGDSPRELLFYIALLLIITTIGFITSRIQCLTHTHPSGEYIILSGKQFINQAVIMATNSNPSASLSAVRFTSSHKTNPSLVEIRFLFTTSDTLNHLVVIVVEVPEGFSRVLEEYQDPAFSRSYLDELYVENFSLDSNEVLEFILSSGELRHECSNTSFPIILELVGPLNQSGTDHHWNITFVTNYYEMTGKKVSLVINPETDAFEVIYND